LPASTGNLNLIIIRIMLLRSALDWPRHGAATHPHDDTGDAALASFAAADPGAVHALCGVNQSFPRV
jgi:hypothetical protein